MNMINTYNKVNKQKLAITMFYVFFVICYVLNGYSSIISDGISMGSLLIGFISIIYIFIFICSNKKIEITKNTYKILFLILCIYYIVSSFFICQFTTKDISIRSMLIASIKLIIWLLMILFAGTFKENINLYKKVFIIFAYIACGYLFIQCIMFYIFHIYVPSIMNFSILKPFAEDYVNYEIYINSSTYRPSSFFSEPAYLCNILLIALILVLFSKNEKNKVLKAFILCISIIVSTSTGGIFYMLLALLFYFFIKSNFKRRLLLILLFLVFVVIYYFSKDFIYSLTFSNNKFISSIAEQIYKPFIMGDISRFGLSFDKISSLNTNQMIFGIGLGNEKIFFNNDELYLNSIVSLIIRHGYIGLFLFIITILFTLRKLKNNCSRTIVIIYIIKLFVSAVIFSIYGILDLFTAFLFNEEKINE